MDPIDAGKDFVQPWVQSLSSQQLEAAMKRRLEHALNLFRGKISDYVLNNEVLSGEGKGPIDWLRERLGFKTIAPYFQWAKASNPRVKFYTNEHSILAGKNTPQYAAMLRTLLDEGAPLGGIDLQGHFFGDRVGPTNELWQKLDRLSALRLPILVTEFGVRATDEKQYADDLRRFYRVCFAHPAMIGAMRYCMWEPEMWPRGGGTHEAPLWRKDWSPTPAADAYIHLVTSEWTTKGSTEASAGDEISFRGFYGTYQIRLADRAYTVEFTPNQPTVTLPIAG